MIRVLSSAGFGAEVAQLVEHVTENHGVGGSIPSLGTTLAQSNDLGAQPVPRLARTEMAWRPAGSTASIRP